MLIIVFFGLLLRLCFLGSIPSGFFRDEAALGYNSYSLVKTGADEFGMKFPLVFRSFEVYFLPMYSYLTSIIVGVLGLNEFSTRLLSALSGSLLVAVSYFIGNKLWGKKVGLICALILSISPWHIFYSRGAFEGNLALTFFALGFYFWIEFNQRLRAKSLIPSVFFFALSMYSYQAERLVVPLFALFALFFKRDWIWKNIRSLVVPCLIGLILLIPLLFLTFSPGGYHRAFGVSVFSTEKFPYGYVNDVEGNMIINNIVFLRAREIFSLYFSYFSPRNLFVEGDYDLQRSVENSSVFYTVFFPLLLLGLYRIFKKSDISLIVWILLAPLPAALTGDTFHTYRSLLLYFPLTLAISLGIYEAGRLVGGYRKIFMFVLGLAVFASFIFFLFNYALLTQSTRARAWDWGYKQIFSFLGDGEGFDKIVIDDARTEPYIHFLFFNHYDPKKYQAVVFETRPPQEYYYTDSSEIRPQKISKFEFRKVDWPSERGDVGSLFVFSSDALPESEYKGDPKVQLLKEIYYPDGTVAYKVVEIIDPGQK